MVPITKGDRFKPIVPGINSKISLDQISSKFSRFLKRITLNYHFSLHIWSDFFERSWLEILFQEVIINCIQVIFIRDTFRNVHKLEFWYNDNH